MALARLVTFTPLTLIKSADVNGEINNILSNPVSLISPSTGAINFNLQAHTNLLPTAITATSGNTGQVLTVTSSGGSAFQNAGSVLGGAGSGVRGLLGAMTSQTGTFSADQYLLQTSAGSGSFVLNSTVAFTVSVGTAGPAVNGRDQAGAFASTYVHWYAITTGINSTVPAGVVSTNPPPTGPTFPTSYSAWSYLGASPYSSASTTLTAVHRFRDRVARFDQFQSALSSGQEPAETAVGLAFAVPTNAETISVLLRGRNAATFEVAQIFRTVTGADSFQLWIGTNGASVNRGSGTVEIANVAQGAFYLVTSSVNTTLSVDVMGYTNPI